MPPPPDATKATRLVSLLRGAILSGAWPPDSKINLDHARRTFGVSLSPLREALARLVAVGLVVLHDNRGYSVAPVSRSDLAEITSLRVDLEVRALSAAIAAGDIAWESDVMRALYRLGRTARDPARPETLEAWEDAHRDFHMTLLSACGQPRLLQFCETLHNLNDRYRRVFLLASGGDRDIAAEHEAIAVATTSRDAVHASAALAAHITRTGDNLLARLATTLPP